MAAHSAELTISTRGQGLYDITSKVAAQLSGITPHIGLCTLFIRHTSASLLIQEAADPSARRDLEAWLNRLVPQHDLAFTHNDEGPDDMPAHIKAALMATSLGILIVSGQLALGRWQGIYLWEHRHAHHARTVAIVVTS